MFAEHGEDGRVVRDDEGLELGVGEADGVEDFAGVGVRAGNT